jgi:signal transduction histidine kinase
MVGNTSRRRLRPLFGSVRFRITAVATVVVGFVLVGTALWSVGTQRDALTDVIDDRVRQRADDITALVEDGTIEEPLAREYDDDGLAQLVTTGGEVVAASPNIAGDPAVAEPPPAGAGARLRTVDDLPLGDVDAEFRLLSRRIEGPDGGYVLHVGGELDDVNESVAVLTRNLAIAFPAVLAVVAVIIWFVVDRSLRRVEAAHQRQQRFVADASHELRTPLTSIRSELEVDLAHSDQRDFVATHRSVLDETVRLQRLVDDLLYLARSDAGAAEFRHEAVDLDEIVLEEARAVRARRGIDVDAGRVSGAQVVGDGDQLARVVRNLLDNAECHARSRVTLALGEDRDWVVFTVADDGAGIPEGQLGQIFERFARVDEARGRTEGGSGLGLAITRDIVTRHGGTVTVEPNHGAGARFLVRLPLGRASESPPAPRPEGERP